MLETGKLRVSTKTTPLLNSENTHSEKKIMNGRNAEFYELWVINFWLTTKIAFVMVKTIGQPPILLLFGEHFNVDSLA